MEKYEIISLIPARGGSERIPRKNIKMMAGKPMMAWTIEASLKSKYITRTFVSTEDQEIKEIALKYGAEVVDRPAELSEGQISIDFALFHLRYHLWKAKYQPDYIIFLHPTSPLMTEKHIDEAFEMYFNSDFPLLLSVSLTSYSACDTYSIEENGQLKPVLKIKDRRYYATKYRNEFHEKPLLYRDDGFLSIGPYHGTDYFSFSALNGASLAYKTNPEDAIDVNLPIDFQIAEMLLNKRIEKDKK